MTKEIKASLQLAFAYIQIETKKSFAYFGNLSLTALQFAFLIFIQVSLFKHLNTNALFHEKYDPTQIVMYAAGYWIIRDFVNVWIDFDLAGHVNRGSLLPLLCRPVHLQTQMFFLHLGQRTQKALLSVILLAFSALVFDLHRFLTFSTLSMLVLSLFVSFALAASFSFLFGLLAFMTENARSLAYPKMLFMSLMGGGFFPIELFPQWFIVVSKYLPFYYIFSVPLKTLTHSYADVHSWWIDVTISLVYMVGLGVLGRLAYYRLLHRMPVLGG